MKRLSSIVLAAMLVSALMTGCSQNSSKSNETADSSNDLRKKAKFGKEKAPCQLTWSRTLFFCQNEIAGADG